MSLNRREFLASTLALTAASAAAQPLEDLWGGNVIDIHSHLRRDNDGNAMHMDGCGVSHALLLSRGAPVEQIHAMQAKYPHRFVWSSSVDVTQHLASRLLTEAVKKGAIGFGELKSNVTANGPELQRLYGLAAELDVPILIHFQEFPHYEGETNYATGIKKLARMLETYPKTRFVGHADAFWANISADYANQEAYPSGPIKPGGVTDKLLSDYENMYGDMSANSGNNALSRDPEFTKDFLKRHQDKLMFGSDCSCADGHGAGVSQDRNPAAKRLSGKCVARETLTVLKRSTTPEVFRKLTWENAQRIYRIPKWDA
ncbi:MAG: amidohydrolase family protein [Acidobacteria bacterium]|nr:amidohydrolase family protein [Acidobacteriota bacterium]